MSDREKEQAEKIMEAVSKLPDSRQDWLLGFAEGLAEGATLIAAAREQNGEASHD